MAQLSTAFVLALLVMFGGSSVTAHATEDTCTTSVDGAMMQIHTGSNTDSTLPSSADLVEENKAEEDVANAKKDCVLPEEGFVNCPGGHSGEITICAGVTEIPHLAFYGCSITKVNLPDSLTSIGNYAFSNTALTQVSFPEGLQTIEGFAFYECRSLAQVSFPDGLQTIRLHAFNGCWSLAQVTFGNGIESIEYAAFYGSALTGDVYLPVEEGSVTVGRHAFPSGVTLKYLDPTLSPTQAPTAAPTASPTGSPTTSPTPAPTPAPTGSPTASPTGTPTSSPTPAPTAAPTASPTGSPTTSPTPAPTPAPTGSPTASPTGTRTSSETPEAIGGLSGPPVVAPSQATPSMVAGTGDPHLLNVHGQRFDLAVPGVHVLLQIPRAAHPEQTLVRVEADARALGGACADMYFQKLNVTGAWARDAAGSEGGLVFSVAAPPKSPSTGWIAVGKVDLKVVWGSTLEGIHYLNVYAKHLTKAGYSVGGLLGEDDHVSASTPPAQCKPSVAMLRVTSDEQQLVGSVAEAM